MENKEVIMDSERKVKKFNELLGRTIAELQDEEPKNVNPYSSHLRMSQEEIEAYQKRIREGA